MTQRVDRTSDANKIGRTYTTDAAESINIKGGGDGGLWKGETFETQRLKKLAKDKKNQWNKNAVTTNP